MAFSLQGGDSVGRRLTPKGEWIPQRDSIQRALPPVLHNSVEHSLFFFIFPFALNCQDPSSYDCVHSNMECGRNTISNRPTDNDILRPHTDDEATFLGLYPMIFSSPSAQSEQYARCLSWILSLGRCSRSLHSERLFSACNDCIEST